MSPPCATNPCPLCPKGCPVSGSALPHKALASAPTSPLSRHITAARDKSLRCLAQLHSAVYIEPKTKPAKNCLTNRAAYGCHGRRREQLTRSKTSPRLLMSWRETCSLQQHHQAFNTQGSSEAPTARRQQKRF